MAPEDILEQAESAAEAAADKVAFCAPNSKVYCHLFFTYSTAVVHV